MNDQFIVDRVVKDLFQKDRPSLLEQMTGGLHVSEFLNIEFQRMIERRADLVARLEDDSLFHFEIQSYNDDDICYRMGIYCLMRFQLLRQMISQQYRRPVNQVVLYVGEPRMRMIPELDAGGAKVSFRLIDIREIDADALLRSGCAGDLALAMLAKGGTERLAEIARRAAGLSDQARVRVMMQLILLSGLRGLSGRLRMEMKTMGSFQIDIRDNVILREVWDEVMAEGIATGKAEGIATGKAEGKAEGEAAGMIKILRGQLHAKFGLVPKWAEERLEKANKAQIERWAKKLLNAQSLEGAIGKK